MNTKDLLNLQLFADGKVPDNLVQKAWAQETWKAAKDNCYFSKFIGKDSNSIVQVRSELAKSPGDKIWIPLRLKLDGAPVVGDNELVGNEQKLEYTDFGISINQYRWAVKSPGRMEEQKSRLNMRQDAKEALQTKLEEWLDQEIFKQLTTNPTDNRVVYAGKKTSENTITTTDKFSTELIGIAKRKAMTSYPLIRPVKVDGNTHYVMVIDPYMARDLKMDEKWINAQKYANVRGKDNPIFSGALGMWDNVIIHECETAPRTKTGSSSAMVGHGLFLGAQACALAECMKMEWNEEDFDYKSKWGISIATILGVAKTQFTVKSKLTDFGCINVLASSADD